jgi:hypothetical protein
VKDVVEEGVAEADKVAGVEEEEENAEAGAAGVV